MKLEEKVKPEVQTPTPHKIENLSFQVDKKVKQQRKRPVTPILMNSKRGENSDLISVTPRSINANDDKSLNSS